MTNEAFIKELKERVEEQYREALEAIERLRPFLLGGAMPPRVTSANSEKTKQNTVAAKNGTFTARVVETIRGEKWWLVEDIKARTGIEAPRIRAVCYSRNRDELGIEQETIDGRTRFRVRPETEKAK